MNTFAPELSALMIILRSTGPVISTRRSWRSAGVGATRHSDAPAESASGGETGVAPASSAARGAGRRPGTGRRVAGAPRLEQAAAPIVEPVVQLGDELQRFGSENIARTRLQRS